jgi:hypothetical protein
MDLHLVQQLVQVELFQICLLKKEEKGLIDLFFCPSYLFRGGRSDVNDSKTNYINNLLTDFYMKNLEADDLLTASLNTNNALANDLLPMSPNMNNLLADDLSTLSPASSIFGDVSLNNSGLNVSLLNNYCLVLISMAVYLRPRQFFQQIPHTKLLSETILMFHLHPFQSKGLMQIWILKWKTHLKMN